MTSLCKFSPNLSFVWNGHFPDNSGHHFNTPNLILRDSADTCWVQGLLRGREQSCHRGNIIKMRDYQDDADAKEDIFNSFHRRWPTDRLAFWSFYKLWLAHCTGWVRRSILAEMSIHTNYGLHNDLNSTSNFTHSCCAVGCWHISFIFSLMEFLTSPNIECI